MYLARRRIQGKTHYAIRHSYPAQAGYESRQLFDLGTDPQKFIIYPGGRGYYYDTVIEEALARLGVETDQTALDNIFLEFLRPDIQRVIAGFDRRNQRKARRPSGTGTQDATPVHLFDRRRFHYLRFGRSRQQYIQRVSPRIFASLQEKSRDELEHYFWEEERRLPSHERPLYVATIFQLHRWSPDKDDALELRLQMDAGFDRRLCRLNDDAEFMAGVPPFTGLSAYLVRYAIAYYDQAPPRRSAEHAYIRDFINRHRVHRPPASIQARMQEAEGLFGSKWQELKKMSRTQLSRAFRRLALKHHPDQGGDAETFQRLSQIYRALKRNKPRDR